MTFAAIGVLPPEVVNQIAAGEVIERPASVVKELLENSLDAGARNITVEVEGGGKSLVRVIDDGHGMTREALHLALERHATSKLRRVEDLFGLETMGFRGEALPSIASVSRMRVTTRARAAGDPAAWQLDIEGGRVVAEREVGAPGGTQVEVRDLLFNVPARQKFMKADATEAAHISDWVARLALANPEVHVRLKSRGRGGARVTLDAPRSGDDGHRVSSVLGNRVGRLHRTEARGGGVAVRAFLAAPELAQSTSRGLQLFVGRRPVKDRGLLHAVAAGYGDLVAKGRYPLAVIFVEVPDPDLDVNVHPQKLEVRFADPQAVYAVVRGAVSRGVAEAGWPVALEASPAAAPGAVRIAAEAGVGRPASRAAERLADYASRRRLFAPLARRLPPSSPAVARRPPAAAAREPAPVADPADPRQERDEGFFAGLRYLGQLDRTYLVCEGEGDLVLVDQHAAHERVELTRLKRLHRDRAMPVQRLLFPEEVGLDAADAAVLEGAAEALAALGFEAGEARADGARVVVPLSAVPTGLRRSSPVEVFRQLVAELAGDGASGGLEGRLDAALGTIACHSAVRAGDVLSPREAAALLADLDGVAAEIHCRHGRPLVLRIRAAELARRFGRA